MKLGGSQLPIRGCVFCSETGWQLFDFGLLPHADAVPAASALGRFWPTGLPHTEFETRYDAVSAASAGVSNSVLTVFAKLMVRHWQ